MIKFLLIFTFVFAFTAIYCDKSNAEQAEPVIKIEIPASSVDTIDVNYKKDEPSAAAKAFETTKEVTKDTTDKTVKATKKAAKTTGEKTKEVKDKTFKATKNAAQKTSEKTKYVKDKTVKATKDFTDKTVDGTKNLIDDLNPNKPVTLEGLESEAELKTLKNERKGIKSAYNSRIKDTNAKIRAAEKSTMLSDAERQNKIYTLNKQKKELEQQRDTYLSEYDTKINKAKNTNK